MSDLSMPRCPGALRLACLAFVLLALGACTPTYEGGGSPPPVDVPEPGTHARAGTAAARGTRPAPVVRPSSSHYPRPSTSSAARSYPASGATVRPAPSASTARGVPAPQESAPVYAPAPEDAGPAASDGTLPLPGATAGGEGGGLTVEQSTSAPSDRAIEPPEFVPVQSHNSAVNTLLAQSDAQRRGGNLDAAIAAAERALRISPDDPAVYYQLAALRLRRGDVALAEQLARKGLSYQPDSALRAHLEEIIRNIRLRS